MAHFDVTVVPGRLVTDTATQKRWDWNGADESFSLPTEFLPAGTTTLWFRRLVIRINNSEIRFILGATPTWPTNQGGDDVISDWEDAAVAMVATQGSNSVQIPGPNFSGNVVQDSGETYIWRPQPGGIFTFFTNLDTAADWTLSIRDPALAPDAENSDFDIGFAAGTPSFSVSAVSDVIQNSDAEIEFSAGTPRFDVSPDSQAVQSSDFDIEFSAGTPSFSVSPDSEVSNADVETEFSAGTPSFSVSPDSEVVQNSDAEIEFSAGTPVFFVSADSQVASPGAPYVESHTANTITLRWHPFVTILSISYTVRYRVDGGAWTTVSASSDPFTTLDLDSSVRWEFQVRATDSLSNPLGVFSQSGFNNLEDRGRDTLRMVVDDLLIGSLVSARSAVSRLPASNVLDELVRKTYRASGHDDEWVSFHANAPIGIDCVFVGNHNFTKDAIVTWEGNTTSSFTSPALSTQLRIVTDSMFDNVVPKLAWFYLQNDISDLQVYQYWRLRVQDTNNSESIQIGRIMAGRFIVPERPLRDGFVVDFRDPSRITRWGGRQGYAKERARYMRLHYDLFDLTIDGWDALYTIYSSVGQHTPFIVSIDPVTRPSESTMYCQFMNEMQREHRVAGSYIMPEVLLEEKN